MDFTYYNQQALTENAARKCNNKIVINKRKCLFFCSKTALNERKKNIRPYQYENPAADKPGGAAETAAGNLPSVNT